MISRRSLMKGMGAVGALGVGTMYSFKVRGQSRPFTFISWGGALSAAEKQAFMDPFAKQAGIEMVQTTPVSYAKVKAMVDAGAVEWDLVTCGGRFIFQGRDGDFLEPIDYSIVTNSKDVDPAWCPSHGTYLCTAATVIGWNTDIYPADAGPQSWKDFWDVQRFPGARCMHHVFYYNYEAALLADGVAMEEVYPVTKEKVDMAIGKLREIKPHVAVWWAPAAQPPQLLSSGEVAISTGSSGQFLGRIKQGAPITITFSEGLVYGNGYVVPKGSPYKDLAMECLNFCLGEEAQSNLLPIGTYGPVSPVAGAKATEQQAEYLIYPTHIDKMMLIDDEQAGHYSDAYDEAWNEFRLE